MTALHDRVGGAPREARASIVATTCRIPLPAGTAPGALDPWALLTSAAVEAELATTDADELRIARELAKLCRIR
jgi:hypothetical protein